MNHFITMLNHSNNELPAISIIFTSRDFGHVIYIFICNMELRDPAASVKHKINLVWLKEISCKLVSISKSTVDSGNLFQRLCLKFVIKKLNVKLLDQQRLNP